jgi:hypothetical protein
VGRRAARAARPAAPTRLAPLATDEPPPNEVLVVASRLKAYVRARSGFNTSDNVLDALSDRLRALADEAIRRARAAGRQTVMDRDVP